MVQHRQEIQPPVGSPRIAALDGIRGLAILMVLWAHFGQSGFAGAKSGWQLMLHNLLDAGWAGVDLFFVLSGFLITGILLDTKLASGGLRNPAVDFFGRFYVRRALRIFPLYYGVIVAVAISTALIGNAAECAIWRDWAPWVWCFAGNIYNSRHGWMAGPNGLLLNHLWSLAVEEQFYLAWPVIVYVCSRRSLIRGCFTAIVLAITLRFYFAVIDGNNYAATLLMPCRIDAFAIGGLLALLLRGPCSNALSNNAVDRTFLARLGFALAGSSACLLVPMFRWFTWIDVIGRTLLPLFFAGLMLLAMFSPLQRVFQFTLLRLFGKYSYGIYILHCLLYHAIDRCFPASRYGALARFAGCSSIAFTIAWCSWHGIERHFLALRDYLPGLAKPSRRGVTPLSARHSPHDDSALVDGLQFSISVAARYMRGSEQHSGKRRGRA